ncbi:alpha/beta hydrolase [Symbioplanes lichenis]|uniref:alpha/beta hydrolase n=1 Tax=Symbioplanes lichenis TaxID=1629072 RepID=UPI00273918AC|nr:hypothetical protein [Actinoplanes lichenis]
MSDQWNEPEGINPRGTVVVAAGRGETPEVYARFGRRLAADAYRVRVLPDVTTDLTASFAAAEKLLLSDIGPHVVIGSDTGALFALALAARGTPGLDGLVLAGLPASRRAPAFGIDLGGHEASPQAWAEADIEARTACPNHQRVLSGAGSLSSAPVPAELAGETEAIGVPVLGLHGSADLISPLAQARGRYPAGPVAALTVIEGGRHDILNDVTHRTVAALVVQFLERLRLGTDLPAIAVAA